MTTSTPHRRRTMAPPRRSNMATSAVIALNQVQLSLLTEHCSWTTAEVKAQTSQTARISRSVVWAFPRDGYPRGMSPFEQFVGEVEVSITDAVDSLNPQETARLYAEVLNMEQRLDALNDALAVLAMPRA